MCGSDGGWRRNNGGCAIRYYLFAIAIFPYLALGKGGEFIRGGAGFCFPIPRDSFFNGLMEAPLGTPSEQVKSLVGGQVELARLVGGAWVAAVNPCSRDMLQDLLDEFFDRPVRGEIGAKIEGGCGRRGRLKIGDGR